MINFTEFEAKFYPVIKDEYREKLRNLGAKLITPERLMRRAIVDSDVFPQITADYIRVRDEGDSIRLSAKTHAKEGGNLSDQKEIDITVSDYDKTIKLIESMGFRFTIYQETYRETWSYENAEITIDTWPGLQTYSEIEAQSEENVRRIARHLSFDSNNRIITGAKELFMNEYNLSREIVTEKMNYITFDNNPFKDLPRKQDV